MSKNRLEEAPTILAYICPEDFEVELVSTDGTSFAIAGSSVSDADMFCVKLEYSTNG